MIKILVPEEKEKEEESNEDSDDDSYLHPSLASSLARVEAVSIESNCSFSSSVNIIMSIV